MRAEDLKANPGTGGMNHVGWRGRITLRKKGKSDTTIGKADDVTQGDLIVSAWAVNHEQGRDGQAVVTDGEKSDVGIVVKKLAGKAAMASESAQLSPVQALTQKAGTWCEARNRCKRSAKKKSPCARQESGSDGIGACHHPKNVERVYLERGRPFPYVGTDCKTLKELPA